MPPSPAKITSGIHDQRFEELPEIQEFEDGSFVNPKPVVNKTPTKSRPDTSINKKQQLIPKHYASTILTAPVSRYENHIKGVKHTVNALETSIIS